MSGPIKLSPALTLSSGNAGLIDVEKMLVVGISELFEVNGRQVAVVSATNVEPDALEVHGLPMVTVQAPVLTPQGSWQDRTGRIGFDVNVAFSTVGNGREEAFRVAGELFQIVNMLSGKRVDLPGCGTFGDVEHTEAPVQVSKTALNAQELVQFNSAARMVVRP